MNFSRVFSAYCPRHGWFHRCRSFRMNCSYMEESNNWMYGCRNDVRKKLIITGKVCGRPYKVRRYSYHNRLHQYSSMVVSLFTANAVQTEFDDNKRRLETMANIKVFSVALYRELTNEQGELPSWVIKCEGLTKQQCTDALCFFQRRVLCRCGRW